MVFASTPEICNQIKTNLKQLEADKSKASDDFDKARIAEAEAWDEVTKVNTDLKKANEAWSEAWGAWSEAYASKDLPMMYEVVVGFLRAKEDISKAYEIKSEKKEVFYKTIRDESRHAARFSRAKEDISKAKSNIKKYCL